MKPNYRPVKYKDVWHIEYDYESPYWGRQKAFFKDFNNEYLEFYTEESARCWCRAKENIDNL